MISRPPSGFNLEVSDLVEQGTFPPIRDLDFQWWLPAGDDGVLTIRVRAADAHERPVLVVRARAEGARSELLMGFFVRSGDRVSARLPAEVHHLIRLGRASERRLSLGIE